MCVGRMCVCCMRMCVCAYVRVFYTYVRVCVCARVLCVCAYVRVCVCFMRIHVSQIHYKIRYDRFNCINVVKFQVG